jgi:xylose isomerase
MTRSYFPSVEPLRFIGPDDTSDRLGYRYYDPARVVLGKPMSEQLRMAVCYWHSFCWPGDDTFGTGSFGRPWHGPGEPMVLARMKLDAAFELFQKLGLPFFTFHDRDVAPEGESPRHSVELFRSMIETIGAAMQRTGVRLLWGTANLFGHPRYAAGAATNPDPEVFACAALQVRAALEATHTLGGENYVLWGGREGYDTLLNTDMKRELDQLGRFMALVVEHKHKLGFKGQLLIEPKPMEPTKHQYDFDTATVHAFLQRYGLQDELKVNIEVNHATLAGHSFQHELAYALANGLFGSVDANRGDPQLGWDTDQFPNSIEEMTLALYTILEGGGLGQGGFNFDAKLRRQSIDPEDLFHSHAGAADVLALSLLRAEALLSGEVLSRSRRERYAGWDGELGRKILDGSLGLSALADRVCATNLDPRPRSSQQERLENRVTRQLLRPLSR